MGVKSAQVRIRVCKSCGWTDKKVRKTLLALTKDFPDTLKVETVGCLDECKNDPVLKIDGKSLAPASRKKIRKAVGKRLG